MVTFCIAYKNEHTIEWAERTGNMAGGWIRISAFEDLQTIKRLFDVRKSEYPNSALAIFPNDNGEAAWYDRRPWYLANRHIINKDALISGALAGLINSKDAGWF